MYHALDMARRDDLVVLFADALTRTWKQVVHFESGSLESSPAATAPSVVEMPEVEMPELGNDHEAWVRDDRGVILAPEESD